MSSRILPFGLAMSVFAAGCDVYDASLVTAGPTGVPVGVPARPAATTEGPSEDPITIALRDIVLDQGERWAEIGFNLDGRVTTVANADQECLPTSGVAQPDGKAGIDNSFGSRFFPFVKEVLSGLEEEANAEQLAGNGTMLLRLTNWNGTKNDPLVRVEIVQAAAGTSADPDTVHFVDSQLVMKEGGAPAPAPAWNGSDHWWARSDGYLSGHETKPNIYDSDAYVVDGVVVVSLPDREDIVFFSGDRAVVVRLTGAFATAKMNATLDGVTDVVVAGRWSADDLEKTAPFIKLCDPAIVALLRSQGLENADVMSDGRPSDTPCDAISMGVVFEKGVKGSFQGLQPMPPVTDFCVTAPDGGV